MSQNVTNKPFFDLVANEHSKKASSSKSPFANNPQITNNEFFNPLENQNYGEILQQMSGGVQQNFGPSQKTPTLSDILNIAQAEIPNISK